MEKINNILSRRQKMSVSIELTLEQLAEGLKKLTDDELQELEMLLDKEELEKRRKEVKSGDYIKLDELKSLKDV